MVNVAYMVNTGEFAGGERCQITMWEGLKDVPSINPIAFCPSNGPMIKKILKMDIPYFIESYFQPDLKKPIDTIINTKKWKKHLKKNNIKLIHANDIFSARPVIKAAYSLKIPVLCHLHHPSSLSPEVTSWAFRHLPKPKGFIFCAKSLQTEYGKFLTKAYPNSRQFVLLNAVNVNFIPAPENKTLRIGIIAQLDKVKGHEDFFTMASILVNKKYNVHFDIIGGDIHKQGRMETLINLVKELGITKVTTFHGNVNNVPAISSQLDIVVCSSHAEGLPLCLLESMCLEKPLVATSVNGIPEIIIEGETGFLVPKKNPELLAKRVEELLKNKNLRISMGKKGRERVEKIFSIKNQKESLIKIYKEFIDIQ